MRILDGHKRLLISVFIIFNLLTITISTSEPFSQQNAIERFFLPYSVYTRLLQKWSLFTPTPRKNLVYFRVLVTFKDRTTVTWKRPYPPNWNFFERHLAYNFQKWDLASNYLESSREVQTDLAHYIQKLYWNDTNPPQTIQLIRAMAPVPPPNESGYVQHDKSEFIWQDHIIFTFNVKDGSF